MLESTNKIATLEEQAKMLKIDGEAARVAANSSAKAIFELLEESKRQEIELRAEKMAWKAIAAAYRTKN